MEGNEGIVRVTSAGGHRPVIESKERVGTAACNLFNSERVQRADVHTGLNYLRKNTAFLLAMIPLLMHTSDYTSWTRSKLTSKVTAPRVSAKDVAVCSKTMGKLRTRRLFR